MVATTIQQQIHEYITELNEAEQMHVLEVVKKIVAEHDDETGRISIEQYNREIDEALEEVEKGNYITHEDLVKLSAQWYKK